MEIKKDTRERFNDFHRDNPKVYSLYKKFANELLDSGCKRIGSKAIVERIRWETAISTTDIDYKINNDYTPLYARQFVTDFPDHLDRFVFKQIKY